MSLDVTLSEIQPVEVFTANITHNLNRMAEEVGIYKHLWRPEELGITTASQLIEPLTAGLNELVSRPDHYKKFNPENGWGTYEALRSFVADYLNACIKNPNSTISICR